MLSHRSTAVLLILGLGSCLNAQGPLKEGPKLGHAPPSAPLLNGFQIPALKESAIEEAPVFRLAPKGWHDLSLKPLPPLKLPAQKGPGEATVEVWDLPLPATREQAFRANLDVFQQRLAQAMRTPPPQYGDLDLAHLMLSDPTRPQALELARVRSIHLRFNRLPPTGTLPR